MTDGKSYHWWSRMAAMTAKELLQLGRDTVLLCAVFYLFTVDIMMAGGVKMDLNQGAIVVHDSDHSLASRELIYRFQPPYFKFVGEIFNEKEGIRLLDKGEALVVLDIPAKFQHDLLQGKTTAVQVQVAASNTVLGTLAASYSTQIIGQYSADVALEQMGLTGDDQEALPMLDDRHRVWYNPNQKDAWFMSISELLTVITILAMMLPAAAAVREKERGTIEQLLVSPLTPMQIMLPKVIAMTLVILIGTAISVGFILYGFFEIPIKGSLPLFFLVTALYTFAMSGLGLFVSTISRNLAQAAMLVIMIMMPILLLSGAWTPPEAMPDGIRQAMCFSPLYYYIEMAYGILLKGAGLAVLWDALLGLTLLGSVVFIFGVWRFKRQFG